MLMKVLLAGCEPPVKLDQESPQYLKSFLVLLTQVDKLSKAS